MRVTVLYFAALREALGLASEQVELAEGVRSVAALREALHARGGDWVALAPGRNVRAAVNQELVSPQTALADGDEVAFFPPVTGG